MSDATTLLSHTGWIQALARNLAGSPEVAEDAAQETWVTALEKRPATDRPVRGWLATVLRSHLAKHRERESHRRSREREVARHERTASTFDLVARATTQKDLVEVVLELDDPYRETILLRFFENLSYRDIALRTAVSPATVNSRITRGLARLRERLDARYGNRQAWLTAFAPLTQISKGAIALGTGALTMSTVTQISLIIAASTTVAVTAWQLEPGTSPDDPSIAPVSLAGGAGAPEGIERLRLPQPEQERTRGIPSAALPAELENAEPFNAALDDTWEMEFSHDHPLTAGVEHLTINSGAGDVTVVRGEGSNMRIDARVKADLDRVDASELGAAFEDHVTITEGGGSLEIRDAHSKRGEQGWSVSLTVHVPGSMALNVFANSGAGDVTVQHAAGELTLNSGAGDVKVSVPEQDVQSVNANSGAGDVEIRVRLVRGSLDGNSGAGDVTASLGFSGGSPQVSLNSSAGDVTMRVPPNVSGRFQLEAQTGSVDVPPSLGLTIVKKGDDGQMAHGVVGAEGGTFKLQSGAGDVRVALNDSMPR